MTLIEKAHGAHKEFSKTASTICRQLGFAGIAIIWVFKVDRAGSPTVASSLVAPAFLIVAALAVDLLQYVSATLIWGYYGRWLEVRTNSGLKMPDGFPRSINWSTNVFFWLKIGLMTWAYALMLLHLARKVF